MTPCTFTQHSPGSVRCDRCGIVVHTPDHPDMVHSECRRAPEVMQQKAEDLSMRLKAAFACGLPKITPVEVEKRLAACRSCEQWWGDGCRRFAGCRNVTYLRALLEIGPVSVPDRCQAWLCREIPP